jgi:hypothetical protein
LFPFICRHLLAQEFSFNILPTQHLSRKKVLPFSQSRIAAREKGIKLMIQFGVGGLLKESSSENECINESLRNNFPFLMGALTLQL